MNHVTHVDSPDNGYEKDENGGYKQINNNGGDSMDYLYENGKVVESRVPFQTGGEVSKNRTYGVLANKGTGGSLYDPSWDMFQLYIGYGEIKGGLALAKMGMTLVPKASSGIRAMQVGEFASKTTLKSSVFFFKILKYNQSNYSLGGKWLTIIGPNASTLSTFLGRNSIIIGPILFYDGSRKIYKRISF
ncbi:hypothetical protein O2K51_10870 [Apibacter raozihei]|uniref:hypothetical protein n=1 Tax=Apibacter raozihei TaxID=2500547 RepID=UPI000FE3AE5D|nr:hypothetical protein [Apibacter raozihei]